MNRRLSLQAIAAAVAHASLPVRAQAAWPQRPLRLLVGFPAGSTPDLSARTYGDALAKAVGQAVIVDNKPGASGNIAAEAVARATDDHTFGTNTQIQVVATLPDGTPNRWLRPLRVYDRMFQPVNRNYRAIVSTIYDTDQILAINPKDDLPYFVDHINPNALVSGDGSTENPFNSLANYTANFSRAYLRHLTVAGEMLSGTLLTIHNLHFFLDLMAQARVHIEAGDFGDWHRRWIARYEAGAAERLSGGRG